MKTFILVLSLGLVASCGTENRYADTLASGDERQNKQGGNTGKIVVGTVAGVILTSCVVAGLKKRCVPFVKRITKTDDFTKELRKAVKDGEITKEEAKNFKNAKKAAQNLLDSVPDEKTMEVYQERTLSLTDQTKMGELVRKGGGSVVGNKEVIKY